MLNGLRRYKVFFPIQTSENWIGGTNYYKNLFFAISLLENNPIEIYIPENNPEFLFKNANLIKLPSKNYKYHCEKLKTLLLGKKFNKQTWLYKNIKNIDIVSHTGLFDFNCPCISWIPDFQHKKLPEFFDKEEFNAREKLFLTYIQKSSVIILSSNDSKNDFEQFYPEYKNKAQVLNFVSYISPNIYNTTETLKETIKTKYKLPDKYFYIPNQFWQHKNHLTVLKALNELIKQNQNIHIVFSGNTEDYRCKDYYQNTILKYINDNGLENFVHILGIIDLDEVYYLMRNCVSIINPSLFEGWSSTVEEAKSIGKNIILSDLPVHREQNPPHSIYFEKNNYKVLAKILNHNWNYLPGGPDFELEEIARKTMLSRMKSFGQNYYSIVDRIYLKTGFTTQNPNIIKGVVNNE